MKNKLKFYLAAFTFLYALLKSIQCSVYFINVLITVIDSDCQESSCLSEFFEMSFIICLFGSLGFLICGALKPKQCLVGLWLVVHSILLMYQTFCQYEIRWSSNSNEYDDTTRCHETIKYVADLVSFIVICRFNNFLIRESFAIEIDEKL